MASNHDTACASVKPPCLAAFITITPGPNVLKSVATRLVPTAAALMFLQRILKLSLRSYPFSKITSFASSMGLTALPDGVRHALTLMKPEASLAETESESRFPRGRREYNR